MPNRKPTKPKPGPPDQVSGGDQPGIGLPTKAGVQDKKPKMDPFDLWLQRGLHQLYDDVAKEPVPDDLLRLIEEDRSK